MFLSMEDPLVTIKKKLRTPALHNVPIFKGETIQFIIAVIFRFSQSLTLQRVNVNYS